MQHTWVIDDDLFAANLMEKQIASIGFVRVSVYTSPYEALENLAETLPDLIVLDIQMPEIDGISFLRELAQRGYPGQLILCSGEDERVLGAAEQVAATHNLDVLGGIRKPATVDQLRSLLERSSASFSAASELVSEAELRAALRRREFINFYQPKVALSDGSPAGAEVLVRWNRPDGRGCPPDQFIPVAESEGLITELTIQVLRNARADLQDWCDGGIQPALAFNISAKSLTEVDIPDRLFAWCRDGGIDHTAITLELTESQLMQNRGVTLDVLVRLRLKGFNLSIDDFGTGYSSLEQLRNVPFNELKIDKSFVKDVAKRESHQAIIRSSASLAAELGMRTVVEGIESQSDWDFARSVGCDYAQGYFISPPLPAHEYYAWLQDQMGKC